MKVVPTVYEDISGKLAYPYQYTFAARVSIYNILSTANILLIPKFNGWILNVDVRNVYISIVMQTTDFSFTTAKI